MFVDLTSRSALVALACIAVAPNASAVSLDVAKKCNELTVKAYPPRVIGNPAAGSTKGSAAGKKAYFDECVAKGGNVDDHSDKGAK